MITPIETTYRGNRFRSRLEAKWATFLYEIGIDYVYEPDGVHLPCGRYLPDFFVPDWDAFVEIKPSQASDREKLKASELAQYAHCMVLLVQGQPWPDEYSIRPYYHGPERDNFGIGRLMSCEFCLCTNCDSIGFIDQDCGCFIRDSIGGTSGCGECRECIISQEHSWKMMEAFRSARSERFGC